jgi:putative pre-16S rRNA nuclease
LGDDSSARMLRASFGILPNCSHTPCAIAARCRDQHAGSLRSQKLLHMSPILALDFGRARIGAAISDELQLLAHPLETIAANTESPSRIAQVVRERKIDHVVVGMPRQMSGHVGAAASEVLEFVEKLRAVLPCPVVTWDERLTTAAAHRALRDAGKKTRHTRGYVDQVAAQMILQSYLDSRARRAASGL